MHRPRHSGTHLKVAVARKFQILIVALVPSPVRTAMLCGYRTIPLASVDFTNSQTQRRRDAVPETRPVPALDPTFKRIALGTHQSFVKCHSAPSTLTIFNRRKKSVLSCCWLIRTSLARSRCRCHSSLVIVPSVLMMRSKCSM